MWAQTSPRPVVRDCPCWTWEIAAIDAPDAVRMHHDRGRIIWGNLLFRVRKYAPDYPGLKALDLTPKGVLERAPEQGAVRFSRAALLGE